ncbi:MAG: acyltransferase family protein [Caulobacter sp.]|nr:acyltransferase family protein [Caulobacter sp.]
MSAPPSSGAARLDVLDGVRGAAALIVMGLHITGCLGAGLLGHGYLMVDLFFVMSGFVLSAGYGARLSRGGAGGWFAVKRLVRLYPLALLGLLLGAAVAVALSLGGLRPLEDRPALYLILGALFLPWLGGGLISPFNGPAWSLQLELWINIAYGFVARRLSNRRLAAIVALAGTALIAVTLVNGQFDGGFANNDPARSAGPWSYLVGWLRVGFAFPLGILLHRLWAAGRLQKIASGMTPWLAPAALLLVALPPPGLTPLYDLAAVLLLFPLLVVLCANAAVSGPARTASAVTGRLSYGLYVLHGPILVAFRELEPAGLSPAMRLGWYGMAAACAIAAAALAERWIDRPARRWAARRDVSATTAISGTVQVQSA